MADLHDDTRSSSIPVRPIIYAIYGFTGKDEVELTFQENQEIVVYGMDESGWVEGQLSYDGEPSKQYGWFPVWCLSVGDVAYIKSMEGSKVKKDEKLTKEDKILTLNDFLCSRPPPEELLKKNIIKTQSLGNPNRIIPNSPPPSEERPVNRLLAKFIKTRPKKEELNERNILRDERDRGATFNNRMGTLNAFIQKRLNGDRRSTLLPISSPIVESSIFGVPLNVLFDKEMNRRQFEEDKNQHKSNSRCMIPIVESCVQFLTRTSLEEEGLFRVSGGAAEMSKIIKTLESQNPKEVQEWMCASKNQVSPHSVASVLKRFFRELPEPLISNELVSDLDKWTKIIDEAMVGLTFSAILNRMPEANRKLLLYLLEFLYKVADKSSVNKMTSNNLGIVWGPALMRDEAPLDMNNVVDFFAANQEEITAPGRDDSATFIFQDEDHTIGNALRYMLMKKIIATVKKPNSETCSPKVSFAGYSIPHPSKPEMNVRVQTASQEITSLEVVKESLSSLKDVCNHILETYLIEESNPFEEERHPAVSRLDLSLYVIYNGDKVPVALSQRFSAFDIFHKTAEDVQQKSTYGAAMGIVAIVLLCYGEASFYLSPPEYTSTLSVNHVYKSETIPLYIRMLFMELPCDAVYLDIMDRFGELVPESRQSLIKHNWKADFGTLINSDGKLAYRWFDRAYEREEKFWYRLRNYIFERPESECLPCHVEQRSHHPENACCNTCLRLKQVFTENGRSAEQADSYPQCQGPKEGCMIEGHLKLYQHRGNLHILAGSSHAVYGGHQHSWQPNHRKLGFNSTHYINLFSFGDRYSEMVNPLDGFIYTELGLSRQQYFLEVVPTTHVSPVTGKHTVTNQYSATFTNNPVDLSSPHAQLPGIFVHYDFSPLKIQIEGKSETLLQFLTRLCAIVGGVWVVVGMTYKFTTTFFDLLFSGVVKSTRAQ
ncbi:hypothetical protein PROFUN_06984 [Planoprotostelium fungivorum]|uniref:Uncharacterized protein n=1 Tax=Planoprotostelium fungivorum TaxID=1890364 RepID=A0A2P6NMM0_9EUKA|nr:hypothetical protein PROFUN_06984 [Planoprotostelium fungivorum]